jgi:NAD(P)H dehydrogenase (quinone)
VQDVNVVIVFCSRSGSTERLALAAAVGAVQARANIRLRRLPWLPGTNEVESERMEREYIAPRDADTLWADAIIFGMPAVMEGLSAELNGYFESLAGLNEQRHLDGKVAAAFTSGARFLYPSMCRAGLITIPFVFGTEHLDAARLQGRRVAEAARALKSRMTEFTPDRTSSGAAADRS